MKRAKFSDIVSCEELSEYGENIYICDVCSMVFSSKNNFERHVYNHSKEKSYECKRCFKSYASQISLSKHICGQQNFGTSLPLQTGSGLNDLHHFKLQNHALKKNAQMYRLYFTNDVDVVSSLGTAVLDRANVLIQSFSPNPIKWHMSLAVTFSKAVNPGVATNDPVFFLTEAVVYVSAVILEFHLKVALRRLWLQIDRFERNGETYSNIQFYI